MGQQATAAVFVDAENQRDLDTWRLARYLACYDTVEKHAFADWRNPRLDPIARKLEQQGFELHYARSGERLGAIKNTADGTMARGVRRVRDLRPDIPVFVLVSGDSFFVGLAAELKNYGKWVTVVADPLRTSNELIATADEYLPVGKTARSIEMLYRLEKTSPYLTFQFAMERLGMQNSDLKRMIERQYLFEGFVSRSPHGSRHEIWLNRRSSVVQSVLRTAA